MDFFEVDNWDDADPSDLIDLPSFFAETLSRYDAVFDFDEEGDQELYVYEKYYRE